MPPRKSTSTTTTRKPRTTKAAKEAAAREAAAAAAAASASPPAEIQIPEYTPLQKTIQNTFASAQGTTATHKKLVVTLRAAQEKCAQEGLKSEKAFCVEFARCLNRALVVKKGEAVADRILRFCDTFVRHIHEKELKDRKAAKTSDGDVDMEMDEEEEEELPNSCTTRFTRYMLQHLAQGLTAANKVVRFRVCQFFALTLNSIPALAEKTFANLKRGLVRRMYDREPNIRVQASLALMRLGFGVTDEDEEDSDDELDDDEDALPQRTVVGRLVDRLSGDNSADVRRAILLNLNHAPLTLPHLLERSRDIDALTRRLVYSRTLPSLGDFRLLTISMREKILRWGLQDRDPAVRTAAERGFVDNWVSNADGDILEVLERLDVVNSKVADLAMEAYWQHGNSIDKPFGDEYWSDLTAESVFLARSFHDYCRDPKTQNDHHIDEKIPEVTHLAFIIQKNINLLIASPAGVPVNPAGRDNSISVDTPKDAAEVEFIVEQLLLIALKADYGDEIGRRKMFALLRESLAIVDLPEATVSRVIEVMRKVSGGEREFCSVILEIIAEVHDTIAPDDGDEPAVDGDDNDSFHSAHSEQENGSKSKKKAAPKPPKKAKRTADSDDEMMDVDEGDEDDDEEERAIKEMVTNLRCLFIAQCMLENVEGDLNSNAHLTTMLNGLIVPAVRSQEAPIRERGLRCLGLCCLLDKPLAEENLTLFAHCFNKGHEELQVEASHIICDILVVHGTSLFESEKCQIEQKTLYKMFGRAITKLDDSPETQAACVEVMCKLFLAKAVEDDELLKAMVVAYFDPATNENLALRQTLSYFLPVYCHSRDDHQVRMQRIAVSTLHILIGVYGDLDEGEEMVTPANIASQIADWTDPRKVFRAGSDESKVNWDVHVELAISAIAKVVAGSNKEEKKVLCQLLGKLAISPFASHDKLQELAGQTAELAQAKTITDAVTRNALAKFDAALQKVLAQRNDGVRDRSRSRSRPGTRGSTGSAGSGGGDTAAEGAVPDEAMVNEMGDLSIVSPLKLRAQELAERGGEGSDAEVKEEEDEEVEDDI
ncbi:hypothetical protein DRE_07300 [Drechslerella stenobrocha 248]|uniref:Nuclear condensin complex subunit 3 C-terminal domain-containing protein n=1 Tax=Drechslerella stenobrocha 248 TaxID=1043628 RepID=W7HIQ6_9PEZI|nr:hypothetical protein DRE_07300 [Drechslerella stenobrocha 248]